MKTRFDTFDLVCSVAELQRLIGMRVNQIYDIDHRTYLIRLQRGEEKCVLLLESGNRIHTTRFEWPKNTAPSGFSMKLRKHLKNKRLESLKQIGTDRVVDLQFGINDAAYHVILEVYDRGNIILTDNQMTILNILRPHTEGDKIKLIVREKYPLDRAHTITVPPPEIIKDSLKSIKPGESLKKQLNPLLEFGAALIEHVLLVSGFSNNCKIGKDFDVDRDFDKLMTAINLADDILNETKSGLSKGFIIQKKESKVVQNTDDNASNENFLLTNTNFHPKLMKQYENFPFKEFESFDLAVDEYFSTMEGQKLDLKILQQEKGAMKKLENVKKDHDKRLESLTKTQEMDKLKAELITRNLTVVDNAILAIQSAVANQMSWPDIQTLINEAQSQGDPVALTIKKLKLEKNTISLYLTDPYNESDGEEIPPMAVDIDLSLTAYGNATMYYDQKRSAAKKQQKTIESQGKALKSAERKTKQTLKEVQIIHSINKLRKIYWFEKFYWFITSENYLVIGGRDQQQNELIVKKYLRTGDIYVHADLTGASSVVIKNPSGNPVPPKSLAEAGTMAVAYSVAWEAKVIAGAWWVHSDQVSKTAPTGEYLTTGSFMIRGKKNYLTPCQLVMGLGFLFRLEDSSIERHLNERRIRTLEEDKETLEIENNQEEKEIEVEDDSEDEVLQEKISLEPIKENIAESDDNERTKESSFPDTQIKIDLSGPKMKLLVENKNTFAREEESDDEKIVFLGDNKPIRLTATRRQSQPQSNQPKVDKEKEIKAPKESTGLKRGQKSRLKKMKEKYKDQDEEDKRLLMEILKPDGVAKEDKRKNRAKNILGQQQKRNKKKANPGNPFVSQEVKNIENVAVKGGDDDDDDPGPAPEIDMLDQLTGKPVEEDELLFAIPVIAPYSTVLNYKFKVKLMPGTAKRGKAAKTAVAVFLKDKTITTREKDLIKAVKDETIARNIPGKVKISAPQIQKHKK